MRRHWLFPCTVCRRPALNELVLRHESHNAVHIECIGRPAILKLVGSMRHSGNDDEVIDRRTYPRVGCSSQRDPTNATSDGHGDEGTDE